MKRQRGQSMVEFALMAPIVFMMIFGMIYGGIMFMQYMHYSNAVRTAAREIAVSAENNRITTKEDKEEWLTKVWKSEVDTRFYTPTVNINPNDNGDVVINVTFYMNEAEYNSLPNILKSLEFPPRSIKAIEYRMKLEGTTNTNSTG
ncbi:MAG: pilus assembly protein [Quinella sp. 1Q7]|nr:pilus assembly protein [Quinella sp. 1Q7]